MRSVAASSTHIGRRFASSTARKRLSGTLTAWSAGDSLGLSRIVGIRASSSATGLPYFHIVIAQSLAIREPATDSGMAFTRAGKASSRRTQTPSAPAQDEDESSTDKEETASGGRSNRMAACTRIGVVDLVDLRGGDRGQKNVEAGALAERARHGDAATMPGDDAMDDGEAEAGAFAHRLGGEERLEDALPRRFVHAAAGIAD